MSFDPSILRVMAITDGRDLDTVTDRAVAAERGGATCVQVRLKDQPARVIADVARQLIARLRIPVLINDRFDIALAAGAAGVHVGADDIAVPDVRRLTPPGFVIGTSVGCDAEIANAAQADFVGIGPIFSTASKADAGDAIGLAEFTRLARATGKPAIGIGGITAATAASVIAAGAQGVAAINAIFASHPEASARALRVAVDAAFVP